VAILAELVQLRASGALSRSQTEAAPVMPGRRQVTAQNDLAPAARAEAVDPVCGMTVATASSRALRHDGADYYFCCAGCRQAFEQDPDAYIKKETRC